MQTWHWRLVTNRSSKTWSASAKPASMSPAATRVWAPPLRSGPSWTRGAPPALATPGGGGVVGRDVALGALVDLWRAVGHGLLGVVHALDRLVGDLDRLDPAQGGLLVDGDDRRHALALVADDPVRERGLVLDERAELRLGHVLLCVDGDDAGDLLGLERVDRGDARVR